MISQSVFSLCLFVFVFVCGSMSAASSCTAFQPSCITSLTEAMVRWTPLHKCCACIMHSAFLTWFSSCLHSTADVVTLTQPPNNSTYLKVCFKENMPLTVKLWQQFCFSQTPSPLQSHDSISHTRNMYIQWAQYDFLLSVSPLCHAFESLQQSTDMCRHQVCSGIDYNLCLSKKHLHVYGSPLWFFSTGCSVLVSDLNTSWYSADHEHTVALLLCQNTEFISQVKMIQTQVSGLIFKLTDVSQSQSAGQLKAVF